MKTYLYNFDPLKPILYRLVKLRFTRVHIICLISAQKRRLWVEYLQSMFWAEIWKYPSFLLEKFQFLEVKFSVYLNRRVFVMKAGSEGSYKTAAYADCYLGFRCPRRGSLLHYKFYVQPIIVWMNSSTLYIGRVQFRFQVCQAMWFRYIFLMKNGWTICKQWRPWSDLVLHYLPVTLLGLSRLQWVNR